jgi:hypothetical protein
MSLSAVNDCAGPRERDLFLRSLLGHLAGTLQTVVGLGEASGFASVVGQEIGDENDAADEDALAVENFSREQVAEVLVDLNRRIEADPDYRGACI